jgi:hypothetical protein
LAFGFHGLVGILGLVSTGKLDLLGEGWAGDGLGRAIFETRLKKAEHSKPIFIDEKGISDWLLALTVWPEFRGLVIMGNLAFMGTVAWARPRLCSLAGFWACFQRDCGGGGALPGRPLRIDSKSGASVSSGEIIETDAL